MKSLLIIGAGSYGRLVKEIAELNAYQQVDFLDDISLTAIGKISDIEKIQENYDGCIVAVGNVEFRRKIFMKIKHPVTLIHPTANISKTAIIGNGCVIEAQSVINSESIIKNSSFICAGAVVNHNSIVGEFCQIDCNAVVAAGAEVFEGTKVNSCTVFEKTDKNIVENVKNLF